MHLKFINIKVENWLKPNNERSFYLKSLTFHRVENNNFKSKT